MDGLDMSTHKLATDELKDEHKVIMRMLDVMEAMCGRLGQGETVDLDFLDQAVDFIRTFADKCHHGKEQDTLFPAMGKKGFPMNTGPIAVMLVEHDQGRTFVKGLDAAVQRLKAGDKTAIPEISRNAMGYVGLLRDHIDKEDNILYPMGERVLSPEDNEILLEEFERIEKTVIGPGKHDLYMAMIQEMERELGIDSTPAHHHH